MENFGTSKGELKEFVLDPRYPFHFLYGPRRCGKITLVRNFVHRALTYKMFDRVVILADMDELGAPPILKHEFACVNKDTPCSNAHFAFDEKALLEPHDGKNTLVVFENASRRFLRLLFEEPLRSQTTYLAIVQCELSVTHQERWQKYCYRDYVPHGLGPVPVGDFVRPDAHKECLKNVLSVDVIAGLVLEYIIKEEVFCAYCLETKFNRKVRTNVTSLATIGRPVNENI